MKIETLIEQIANDKFAANLNYQGEQIALNINAIKFDDLPQFIELMKAVEERLHRG